MFNPGSSRSRVRIRDSGRRYSFRLRTDGRVEYSIDGEASWNPITPLNDPCTDKPFHKFTSHENVRIGEELPDIVFDQIAVGRGRIIGKEAGTDRLFHLYIDEMFRTFHRDCNPGEKGTVLDEDAPVPPFNMKVDPEYFRDDSPTVIVPPEGTRNYSNHPGSLRLPVFNELIDLGISDVMLVLERARTWYLKDTRSQLAIVTQDDLLGFTDQDLTEVFTVENIRNVLESAREAAKKQNPGGFILDWLLNIEELAGNWAAKVVAQGSGVMVFAAYAAFGLVLRTIGESGAIRTEAGGKILIEIRKLFDYLDNPPDLKPEAKVHVDEAIAKLMDLLSQHGRHADLRGRERARVEER
jgi:hypothetical protein